MRPKEMKTKIFLDNGDPDKTRETLDMIGFLDGQTTNPTLISRNPDAAERLKKGDKFSKKEIYDFYRKVVKEISGLIPDGSVSVEVYADKDTKKQEICAQARQMFSWIPNAHVKLPTTELGLACASELVKEGVRVNMTLCFSQQQAAAVHAATKGAKRGDVFVSPFIGRLDDRGENGMELIKNVLNMYKAVNSRVEVLTASVRSVDHVLAAIQLNTDVITIPFDLLKKWALEGLNIPAKDFTYAPDGLKPIEYEDLDLSKQWDSFELGHELTESGMEAFSKDWNKLIA